MTFAKRVWEPVLALKRASGGETVLLSELASASGLPLWEPVLVWGPEFGRLRGPAKVGPEPTEAGQLQAVQLPRKQ